MGNSEEYGLKGPHRDGFTWYTPEEELSRDSGERRLTGSGVCRLMILFLAVQRGNWRDKEVETQGTGTGWMVSLGSRKEFKREQWARKGKL